MSQETPTPEPAVRRVQPTAPASAQPTAQAPEPWRVPRPWWVVSGALTAAVLAFVLAYSLDWAGEGSLGALVEPSGRAVARLHAQGSGRGLGYEFFARASQVASLAPVQGPADGIHYTIQTGGTLHDIARIFSMPLEALKQLNPELPEDRFLGPGSSVCVYRPGVALAELAPGQADTLYAGMPLPDGPGRRIRRRSRSWGRPYMVNNLDRALSAYGAAYPQGPVVIVSDMSRREGGKLPPHHTHRDGRDVDLSYIPRPSQDNGGFMKMNKFAFDLDRNWALLRAMLDTGSVELILMDTYLQKLLVEHLEEQGVPKQELRRIFQHPRDARAEVGIIRHWEGHLDHMHVRFSCPPADPDCR